MIDDPQIRTLAVNGERRIAAFQLTRTVSTGVFVPANAAVPAHYVLAGPESGPPALMTPRLLVPTDVGFAAILAEPNVFTNVNTIKAVRLGVNLVTTDYTVLPTDYLVLVDTTLGVVTVTLPPAVANGQLVRIKKIDSSTNHVLVLAVGTDTINADTTVLLNSQFQAVSLTDAELGRWDKVIDPTLVGAAMLDEVNTFTRLNIFNGIQLARREVTADYTVGDNDFEILANAASGSINISLPQTHGEGRFYHIKRIDETENLVAVLAFAGDNIDGSISVILQGQYADCLLFGAASGYWDNMGASGAAGGGTIPETTNLLVGDGAGDAADSGIDPTRVVEIQSPLPARPTTLNEAIALLVSYGFCA